LVADPTPVTPPKTAEYPAVIQVSSTTGSPNITMSSESELDQKSIMELYWLANTSFRQLLNSYEEPPDAPVKLADSYGRLKVWAENVAAHRRGKVSLDHRLREASSVRCSVKELLTDLKTVLDEGRLIRTSDISVGNDGE
jgi:hypothetical protein